MGNLILGPIIGGLSHNHVNLWARADQETTMLAWLGHAPDGSDAKLAGFTKLTKENGFAGVVPVSNLIPDTQYYFALTITPEKPAPEHFYALKTFPVPGTAQKFRFAFGSCFKITSENSGAAFEQMLSIPSPEFLLMLGDQVYTDVKKYNGIQKIAASLEEYRNVYQYNFSHPALQKVFSRLPTFMTMDDHEVDDDWHWSDTTRTRASIPWYRRLARYLKGYTPEEYTLSSQRVKNALQAYWEHQAMHAPSLLHPFPVAPDGQYSLQYGGSFAYTFIYGPAAFFVMDTRTMRVKSRKHKSMLGEDQWQALETWLDNVKDAYSVKFIVTSASILYPLWIDIMRDRWSGFRDERAKLFGTIASKGVKNVYFLAGDLHSAHAASAELYGPNRERIPIHEFCASPFSQKSNWLSHFFFQKIWSGPITKHRRTFSVGGNNFGIVEVENSPQGQPQVKFTVHYQTSQTRDEWKTIST